MEKLKDKKSLREGLQKIIVRYANSEDVGTPETLDAIIKSIKDKLPKKQVLDGGIGIDHNYGYNEALDDVNKALAE